MTPLTTRNEAMPDNDVMVRSIIKSLQMRILVPLPAPDNDGAAMRSFLCRAARWNDEAAHFIMLLNWQPEQKAN
jgi:hypothetical protein